MKRLLSLLIALVMLATMAVPVFAATDADVDVTATPRYIAITDNVTDYDFGFVAESATPAMPTSFVGITNTSNCQTDMTIGVTTDNWSGGVTWAHSDNCTPDADTAGLKASKGTGAFDVIVKYAATWNYLYEDCPISGNFTYELKLYAPTSFGDFVQKTIKVRVSAAAG